MTKIKDVADAAKVSTATVSRVLAGKPNVRPEVIKRVLETVQKLGYRPNRVARTLRSNKSNIIGLIVSDIENPFFQQVSRAVEDAALEQGYSVVLCNTDEKPEKEMMYLQLLHDENVAGIILSPTRQAAENPDSLSALNMPLVIIDRRINGGHFDNIITNNGQSAYTIVSHLIAQGHHRIGAVFGACSTTGRERREGYLQALKEKKIKALPELVEFANHKEEDGFSAAMKLLQLSERPDAIFTSNSLLAAGVLRALKESNIAIPDEIAFASFDETRWAALVAPPITVIEQPTYEIGQTATLLLAKRIIDPSRATREVMLNTKLIIRKSCGSTDK
jgi:LacI family fructose operon transcriptional repressor